MKDRGDRIPRSDYGSRPSRPNIRALRLNWFDPGNQVSEAQVVDAVRLGNAEASDAQPAPPNAARCASADSSEKQQNMTSAMPGETLRNLETVRTAMGAARSTGKP